MVFFVCGAALLSGGLFVRADANAGKGNGGAKNCPKSNNANSPSGSYSITAAGHWNGKGQATIQTSTIGIVLPVVDDGGNAKTLTISNLLIDATSHFSGNGDIDGSIIQVSGRIEPNAPDANGNVTGWRVIAIFHDANGSYGVLAGSKVAASSKAKDSDDQG
jgi:hypothetical protein